LGTLILLLAWDASGLDLPLARLAAGGGHGFALRDSWFAGVLLHDGMRQLAFAAAAWLLVGIWWPVGVLRRISRRGRVQWLASLLLGLALINLLKQASQTSCPWDLAEFGGVGTYVQHWVWWRGDGGPGHCFPAGHASAAFAFAGGFFALRPVSFRLASRCLAVALAAGLVLGLAQQFRGAHFMSHTLWTAWLCWVAALSVDAMARMSEGKRPCLS
jgi:membrane-associated PAP2 superfamily phosphatase